LPAAGQILFEGAIFALVSVFAARLDEVSLAAHSIALNVVSNTFMVPLGISSAAAVRVGHALGAGKRHEAAMRGWMAMAAGAIFMASAGLLLACAPRAIVRLYSRDAVVIASGAVLLRIAALFQLFDGLQVVATGALRGWGDTRTPMLAHLIFYWGIGLPAAWYLCFPAGWGAAGIWAGVSAALILIGVSLVAAWRHATMRQAALDTGKFS
jgi:MATE family multidrug resistance protein